MEKTVETLRGDTPGTQWRFAVLRFFGATSGAPSAYLQAALHANELPGVAALHYLVPMLAAAEREGRVQGNVTLVPQANPIAAGQHLFGEHMGRFALNGRTNFNRDFPLLTSEDTSGLPGDDAPMPADRRLKARLVGLALGADLVLDLHCDDEGPSYLYIPRPLWPHMRDLAAALGARAVLLSNDSSDGAFEEAAYAPYRDLPIDHPDWRRRAITTVEFRGRADVAPDLARADARGLYRFLVARGVVHDATLPPLDAWNGPAEPLENVEMIVAPAGGALLYHVAPGDRVEAGDTLATILTAPGEEGGETVVTAPQGGLVLTRRTQRSARLGDDILKLVGSKPSASARDGALES